VLLTFVEVGLLLLVFTRWAPPVEVRVDAGFVTFVLLVYPLVFPREVEECVLVFIACREATLVEVIFLRSRITGRSPLLGA
jgi:hypothetical protein